MDIFKWFGYFQAIMNALTYCVRIIKYDEEESVTLVCLAVFFLFQETCS